MSCAVDQGKQRFQSARPGIEQCQTVAMDIEGGLGRRRLHRMLLPGVVPDRKSVHFLDKQAAFSYLAHFPGMLV
ncbi:hypothetical protein GCM10023219_21910 [Stakelama sediminis]